MSLQFYFAILAVSVWMFGTNGQSPGGVFSSVFYPSPPQNFLSGLGGSLTCPYTPAIVCPTTDTGYRSIDGSCNNAKTPYQGKSTTPYIRAKPSAYIGGKTPRTTTYFGKLLETPRDLTLKYFGNLDPATKQPVADAASTKFANVAAVFIRFIEQDLYDTKLLDASACSCTAAAAAGICNNIVIKADDPFFGPFKKKCLPKANMVSSPKLDCTDTVSQQVNLNTHYLDLSNIYGSTDTKSNELRQKTDGLLKVTLNVDQILLPKTTLTACQTADKCFLAGDSRVNNDPLLMTMYTIWVRIHNIMAAELKGINPTFDDEKLFQEARKIVIALYQHIVYSEVLPSLNPSTTLMPSATPTVYDENVKPQIANYFSLAFTALADTMTQGNFVGEKGVTVKLEDSWYKPDTLWTTDGVKVLADGMVTDKAGMIDRFYPEALYDQYLQTSAGQGTDKSAVNVEQSRENGINTYFVMLSILVRKYTMSTYADLTAYLEATAKTELEKLYKYIYDIEFLPGLLGEIVTAPAVTGQLMADILEKQFENLRNGDKFFYNHKDIFEDEPLAEIKKVTMGKVLCKAAAIEPAEGNVFVVPTTSAKKTCAELMPDEKLIDICKWATVGWTDWVESTCIGGIIIKTRQCQYGPDSNCECDGSPVQIDACPPGLQLLLTRDVVDRVENAYLQYFDKQGRPKEGVKQSPQDVAKYILDHVVRK